MVDPGGTFAVKITAPTPVFTYRMIIVASGRAPERPIFAIRPGGEGDITPAAGADSSPHVAWRKTGRGSYMPTPLIYNGAVYVLANQGLLDAYEGEDFVRIIRQVTIETGEELWSWIYVLADPEAIRLGTLIADCYWVRDSAEQG